MEVLQTERLRLRRLVPDDLDDYHNAVYGDADVMKYLPGGVTRPKERTAQLIELFNHQWQQDGFGAFAVILKAENRLIGHCGLTYIPNIPNSEQPSSEVELFYALGKSWWGRGYTTEASRAVLRFGFDVCKLEKIVALAVPENEPSRRVMEKLDMKYMGHTTQFYGGAELAYYVVTKDELKNVT